MRFIDVKKDNGYRGFQRHIVEPAICFDEYDSRYARLNKAAIESIGLKYPERYYTMLRVSPEDRILAIRVVKADGPPSSLHKRLLWSSGRYQMKFNITGLADILGSLPTPGYYPLRTEDDIDYYYAPIGPEDRIAEKWPFHGSPRKRRLVSMTSDQLANLIRTAIKEESQ